LSRLANIGYQAAYASLLARVLTTSAVKSALASSLRHDAASGEEYERSGSLHSSPASSEEDEDYHEASEEEYYVH